jgi:hypothetical protein
MVAGA